MREDLHNLNADKCILYVPEGPEQRVATMNDCKDVCGPAVAKATEEDRTASIACIALNGPSQVERV
jgi:hypothetical protein